MSSVISSYAEYSDVTSKAREIQRIISDIKREASNLEKMTSKITDGLKGVTGSVKSEERESTAIIRTNKAKITPTKVRDKNITVRSTNFSNVASKESMVFANRTPNTLLSSDEASYLAVLSKTNERLIEANISPLTDEEIDFYGKLSKLLEEKGIYISAGDQAKLLGALHIKGNVEAIDLKRYGIQGNEEYLNKLSKSITLEYDPEYYKKIEEQKAADQKALWQDLWQGFLETPIISKTVEAGKWLIDEAFQIIIEAPARLVKISEAWIEMKVGLISCEEFNKMLDEYCEFANRYIEHLKVMVPSVLCGTVDWCIQFVIGTGKLFVDIAYYISEATKPLLGLDYNNGFKKISNDLEGAMAYYHEFYRDLAPDKSIYDNVEFTESVLMLVASVKDLMKNSNGLKGILEGIKCEK